MTLEVRDATAVVTLNRPQAANALSCELVGALGHAFDRIAQGEEGEAVRAVIVTGAGDKAFCAGADLKERRAMTLDETKSFLRHLNKVVDTIAAFPKPVIAAINGAAYGGGLELALACDFRLAAETAEVGLVETRLGIIPGAGGTQRLARVTSVAVAKELILTGRRIGAARAKELGVVGAVVPAAELAAAAQKLAAELAGAGPLALAQAKKAIDGGVGLPMKDALAVERASYAVVLESEDRNEGLAAFAEKRPPKFTGK
ncbi:MAG TPA: enoyl-CoA hydratase-related protein [Polyangia bacterium]|nr:enoyl-CoA hydratase-related protein [Polyangia bacterium]